MSLKVSFIFGVSLFVTAQTSFAATAKWSSEIKPGFDDSSKWMALLNQMHEQHFHYGMVAGSERMLQYFIDIKSKEFAYQSLVRSVDEGYPYSLSHDFIAGDLELTTSDSFAQSYNLYKATANTQKNMAKWAENYFNRVDKINFNKYLFYHALESAKSKKLDDTLAFLDQTLNKVKETDQAPLARKAARTLARTLYANAQYKQSLDIYQNYLLKLNPIDMEDWIEAAWNLFRLGQEDLALGYLFNLDSLTTPDIYLEPYVIRSLIYRNKCDAQATEALNQEFEAKFGATLEGIKTGKALKSFPVLKLIYNGTSEYARTTRILNELQLEKKRVPELPSEQRALADFLYSSEINSMTRKVEASEEEALDAAARNLVIMSESLKFLKFDVAREKFNPDKVFAADNDAVPNVITEKAPMIFEIHWVQWNDYWRDERLLYKSLIKSRCQ